MNKKKIRSKYVLIRERYQDNRFLYSDVLRKFNNKRKAEITLQNIRNEYENLSLSRNCLYSDNFLVKKVKA